MIEVEPPCSLAPRVVAVTLFEYEYNLLGGEPVAASVIRMFETQASSRPACPSAIFYWARLTPVDLLHLAHAPHLLVVAPTVPLTIAGGLAPLKRAGHFSLRRLEEVAIEGEVEHVAVSVKLCNVLVA